MSSQANNTIYEICEGIVRFDDSSDFQWNTVKFYLNKENWGLYQNNKIRTDVSRHI